MNYVPNPIAFNIFGLEIRWYAIIVCAGIVAAASIMYIRAPRRRGIRSDDILDIVIWSLPVGIVGARAWYVFFNRADYHTFFEVINTRAGGLAIQGGLIFGGITMLLVCRHKKLSVLDVFDLAAPCVALGQAIGRWGNYFNSEAHGGPTDLPWGIMVDGVKVHPTFLYESLWCLMLFVVLSQIDAKRRFRGQITGLYLMLYSLERLFVEQLRTDSLLCGPAKLVQALQEAGYDPSAVDGVIHAGNFLIFPFKTAQFICVCCMVGGAVVYTVMKGRSNNR